MKSCLEFQLGNISRFDRCYSCISHYERNIDTIILSKPQVGNDEKVPSQMRLQTHAIELHCPSPNHSIGYLTAFKAGTSCSHSRYCFVMSSGSPSSQDLRAFCQIKRRISLILIVNGEANPKGSKMDDATERTTRVITEFSLPVKPRHNFRLSVVRFHSKQKAQRVS